MSLFFGNLFIEAAAVGVVCLIFLALMVYAGIRQVRQDHKDNGEGL